MEKDKQEKLGRCFEKIYLIDYFCSNFFENLRLVERELDDEEMHSLISSLIDTLEGFRQSKENLTN